MQVPRLLGAVARRHLGAFSSSALFVPCIVVGTSTDERLIGMATIFFPTLFSLHFSLDQPAYLYSACCMFAFGECWCGPCAATGMTFVSFSLVLADVIDHDTCLAMELRLQERKGGIGSSRVRTLSEVHTL